MLKIDDSFGFKLSDVVFIMLINDKMPTIFNIYEHDKFHAQLN